VYVHCHDARTLPCSLLILAYKKEGCSDDPGWCFTAAVGSSLPDSFFSFPELQVTDPAGVQALAASLSQINLPSQADILMKASVYPSPPSSYHNKRRRSRHHQKLAMIHQRRRAQAVLPSPQTSDDWQLDPRKRSLTKGYRDGFLTAKIFATYGISRLGFVGQYTEDSLAALGPSVIQPGTEQNYRDGMGRGLRDAELRIASILKCT
jgi:glucan 1,3-beta-glucosidase